jgi:hypothetical protein
MMHLTPQKLISKGGHRCVYTTEDPEWVIKIQQKEGNYNYAEWSVWNILKHTKFGNLLAPCGEISSNHMQLLQRKGLPLEKNSNLPIELLPGFLAYDVEVARQWVIISGYNNGKPVLCDYDHNQFAKVKQYFIEKEKNK